MAEVLPRKPADSSNPAVGKTSSLQEVIPDQLNDTQSDRNSMGGYHALPSGAGSPALSTPQPLPLASVGEEAHEHDLHVSKPAEAESGADESPYRNEAEVQSAKGDSVQHAAALLQPIAGVSPSTSAALPHQPPRSAAATAYGDSSVSSHSLPVGNSLLRALVPVLTLLVTVGVTGWIICLFNISGKTDEPSVDLPISEAADVGTPDRGEALQQGPQSRAGSSKRQRAARELASLGRHRAVVSY